nr:transporter substrate-binding domain-containing protein [Pseudodesulfovibrio sp. JC047]
MPYIGSAIQKGNSGLLTDILIRVYEPEGYELIHQEVPYTRAIKALQSGVINCTLDIETQRTDVLHGRHALAMYTMAVMSLRGTTYTGLDSLAGKKVAYLHGYDFKSLLPVRFTPRQTYDLSSAIEMLDRKTIDFVIDDRTLLKEAMDEAQLPSTKFTITPLASMKAHLIFPPTPQGRLFRNIYDRRIPEMINSGELQKIMREHQISDASIKKLLKANAR